MKRAFLVCLIAGCAAAPGGAAEVPDDGDDTEPTTPAQPVWDGTYQLVSRVDITVEALLPEQAAQMVATLRALSSNPARALIDVAGEAGVPEVDELYGALPGPVQDRLDGWINDELAQLRIGGLPITAYAARLTAVADTALTGFAIDSELTLRGTAARHRLTGLSLAPAGAAIAVSLDDVPGELVVQDTAAAVTATGALTLGDQRFGLAYGEYVWRGIEAAALDAGGAGVREALGGAVSCPELAHRIAGKCLLGACVGHEAELTRICDAGLDAIVDLAHDRVTALRFDVLHLEAGTASLADTGGDAVADRITAGVWQAELDLGQGPRHAPATFAGSR